jgi:hypothetical protein
MWVWVACCTKSIARKRQRVAGHGGELHAYQLIDSASSNSIHDMEDELQRKDDQEKRRHDCEGRRSRCVGQSQRMLWLFGVEGGGATLCHTVQLKLAEAARAGPSRLALSSSLPSLDIQHS